MEFTTVGKYLIYTSVPVLVLALVFKPKFLVKLRQQWLVRLASGKGHSHHSHGHGHSHQGQTDREHTALKTKLFEGLSSQTQSRAQDLKDKKLGIRILEIGVGTGANFRYFPETCQFLALDPNPEFENLVKENLSKFPGIHLEQRLICGAEHIVGVENGSVDVVIATAVFCNVKDVNAVFNEIKRILVPGGKFYYMDHVAHDRGTMKRFLEDFVTITGLSRLFLNASLNRDIGKDILKTQFSEINQHYSTSNNIRFVVGAATK